MQIECITLGSAMENCYLVSNDQGETVIFDPGAEANRIIDRIERLNLKPQAICLTHAHFDHIGAVDAVRDRYEIDLYGPSLEGAWLTDPRLNLSAFLPGVQPITQRPLDCLWQTVGPQRLGNFHFTINHLPGHSPGHLIYVFQEAGFVIAGDTLFEHSIGRTDLPGGDSRTLLKGIRDHLLALPDTTVIYPGHGPATTVGEERKHNPFLK